MLCGLPCIDENIFLFVIALVQSHLTIQFSSVKCSRNSQSTQSTKDLKAVCCGLKTDWLQVQHNVKADFQPVLRSHVVCFHFCFEFVADVTLR